MTPRIEHLIVLMLENRSYDHMLGYADLPGADGLIGKTFTNLDREGVPVSTNTGARFSGDFCPDPGHDFSDLNFQQFETDTRCHDHGEDPCGHGHPAGVIPIPGPSAVATALSISGFGGEGFVFLGYLPRKPGELRRLFQSLATEARPAVAFESPHRVLKSLAALAEILPDRQLMVGRELTKLHEQVVRGTAAEALEALAAKAKGEFTLVLAGCPS